LVHWKEERVSDAWLYCARAVAAAPDHAEACGLAADIQARRGLFDEAIAYYRRALALRPDLYMLHCNMLVVLNYVPGLSAQQLLHEHRIWAMRHADPLGKTSRSMRMPGKSTGLCALDTSFTNSAAIPC